MRRVSGVILAGIAGSLLLVPAALAAPPPNDDFANAQPLAPAAGVPASASGTTVDATSEAGESAHDGRAAEHSVWFSWTANLTTRVEAEAVGGSDPRYALYTGDSLATIQLVPMAPNRPGGSSSRFVFDAVAGQTYRIAVDSGESLFGPGTGEVAVAVRSPPPPTISIAGTAAAEGDFREPGTMRFPVTLSYATPEPVRVMWKTANGEALPGEDYVAAEGTLVFEPGQTNAEVPVEIVGDIRDEPDERLYAEITGHSYGYVPPGSGRGAGMIRDDDEPLPPGVFCGDDGICWSPGEGPVRASSSGARSELRKTIPITKHGDEHVVMRIGRAQLGPIDRGDAVEVSAEVEVSVTCVETSARCVGSRYRYSPRITGRIVLAGPRGSNWPLAVSRPERLTCSQDLPHRNHHCVLVFEAQRETLRAGPCARCQIELLLSARHRKSGRGDMLVVGSDAKSGIEQDRGRLNALLLEPEAEVPSVEESDRRLRGSIPVANRRAPRGPRRVVYSVRLGEVSRYEQFAVDAEALVRTSHLPYGTFIGSQIVLSRRPNSTKPAGVPVFPSNEISEKNGFNCTRGRSAHPNPCVVRKVGLLRVTREVSGPLYANLVLELGARWGGRWHNGQVGHVLDRGSISVRRYGPAGWLRSFQP